MPKLTRELIRRNFHKFQVERIHNAPIRKTVRIGSLAEWDYLTINYDDIDF